MADYLTTGAVINALNMASVTAEEAPKLTPYMKLAEQLGSFAGQLTESGLMGATITYAGEAAGLNHRPLTATVLMGLLRPLLTSVNMVNAPLIARERNIDVTIVERERVDGYRTLIDLTVQTERGERNVAGTLFQGEQPRVVQIRGIPIEAQLGPHTLYIRNRDKPGFIGALGTALGDAGINIATFHLGRSGPGGDAIALIEVDQPVPDDVLRAICELPHVVQVKALSF
jgi:D-3-phosphoglycerate dehydrogenase / 2-oxoglutarate reductase